jgi:hypothetical protein
MRDHFLGIYRPSWRTKRIFRKFIREDTDGSPHIYPNHTISKTNWFQKNEENSVQEFGKLIYSHLLPGYEKFVYDTLRIRVGLIDAWYQVYNKYSGASHVFHDHPECSIANAYYIDLKDPQLGTQFMIDNNLVRPKVREGDVIMFNGKIRHRSPPNHSGHDKVIVAFNVKVL